MNVFSKNLLMASGEKEWIQPTLTANGTIGGNSFAVADYYGSGINVWKAFDSDTSRSFWQTSKTFYLVVYNPTPIKIKKITFQLYTSNYGLSTNIMYVYGKNSAYTTDSGWTTLYNGSVNGYGTSYWINVNSSTAYKAYKFVGAAATTSGAYITNIVIEATEKG